MKICYVINSIKNRFGLDVFKTRNIMNFDCSLIFGKVDISHSGITYMTYLQPHSSRNEGKKKRKISFPSQVALNEALQRL